MPKLQVTLPDGSDFTHELTDDLVTVGRLPDNTIQIDDASVSSHHAQLTLSGEDYVMEDLGSTNGTRYNGKSVAANEECRLKPGDRVRFGSIEVLYVTESVADQRPMPEELEAGIATAATSVRPANFSNASPFQTKKKKKDKTTVGLMVFAAVAILVFVGAVVSALMMVAPEPAL
jgi:pSer/pThr/pTyr-binding forkhead associated (FHA) protein